MNDFQGPISVHPVSEALADIQLTTLGGKATVSRTDEALTPYGGLVAWSAFLKHLGIIDRLAQRFPISRTSPNAAPVGEILLSCQLSMLVEARRFCHVRWVQDDAGLAMVMGMKRVRGEDCLPRLVKPLDSQGLRAWIEPTEQELFAALPDGFVADWDSTVNTRYGHQEDAAVGYNPHKRGRPSHHPLICVAAGTRLCLHLEWRKGNTVSASGWQEAMEKLWGHRTIQERLWLNRGDIGFGQEGIMAWHEKAGEKRPKYLFKLRLTRNIKRALAKIPWPMWEGKPTLGCEQIAETEVKLEGWTGARRIVIVRTLKPVNRTAQDEFWEIPEEEVHVYVTNLERGQATPEQVVLLYRKRADAENVLDELKNQWGFRGFCSARAVVTEAAARLLLLTYNLWTLFIRIMDMEPGKHIEAIRSRRDFLIMAGQVVRSGRQKVVKLAITAEWWRVLRSCYERLSHWISTTAPQLAKQEGVLRLLTNNGKRNPAEWFNEIAPEPST